MLLIRSLIKVLVGESFRDGLLKLPDGQIKAVQDGYPVSGAGVIRVDDAFYYAPKLETSFAKTAGGYDFDMMTTDGAVDTISADELNAKLADLKKDLFMLRMQHATNQLDNPLKLADVKDIARIKTVLREKELQK